MAQIDHGKSNEMSAQKVSILAFEPDQQSFEFINPGESAFTGKAPFVDFSIEQAFAASFGRFAIALVFVNVRNNTMIEAGFAGILGVKSLVGIEEGPLDIKFQTLHRFECRL